MCLGWLIVRRTPTASKKRVLFQWVACDTSLMDIVRAAGRWWADFRGESIQGRPPNSGAWADPDEFRNALRTAITALRKQGRVATQHEVAMYFCTYRGFPGCNDRQLRRWLARYGVDWQDFLTSA